MDEDDEVSATGSYDGGAAYAAADGGAALFSGAGVVSDGEGEGEDDALDVLMSLAALSRQLAADAAADDELVASINRIEAAEAAAAEEEQ